MFRDRADAGEQLADALEPLRDRDDLVVLAIPRGGTELGHRVARRLDAPLHLLVVRKLPYPDTPEAGFGAVSEGGAEVTRDAAERLPEETVERVRREQRRELRRRVEELRTDPLPDLEGRTVVLVDDGVATGSTMLAAVRDCRGRGADEIVVAVPVAGPEAAEGLAEEADRVVALETPERFRAVAQVYEHWRDVTDEEARAVMERHRVRPGGN